MRKKILWLLVSAVIILAMLLTACKTEETSTSTAATTTATTTSTTAATITTTTTQVTTTTTTTAAGTPKYGGTLNLSMMGDLQSYDSWSTNPHVFARMIYDAYISGDIETTEDEWPAYGIYWPKQYLTGILAESWEETALDTTIIHLRQGIHFQNLPPVNGREMTADDVVYSWNRARSPQSQIASSQNLNLFCKSVTALDKYTIEYKYKPEQVNNAGGWWSSWFKSNTWPVAKEVVDKYNGSLANPIGQVGTGPYIIKDYVPNSALTFIKNPDYWGTDPRYPGNKLPYIDNVKVIVIPDWSTNIAALRTGKIDRITMVPVTMYQNITQTSPEILYRRIRWEGSQQLSMRNDIPPFNNVKVRQALSMATDRHAIVDQYYRGNAQYSNCRVPEYWQEFIPLDQFPQEIQDIYNYDPEKARALLAEAGYPDGFQTEIIVAQTSSEGIDISQLLKTWWMENLNVDLKIRVMDGTAAYSLYYMHVMPAMFWSLSGCSYPSNQFSYWYQPDNTFRTYNVGNVKDPIYNAKYEGFLYAWDKPQDVQDAAWYDLIEYTRESVTSIDIPVPDTFLFWQPWLKGHWGQTSLTFSSSGDLYKYMWIDK